MALHPYYSLLPSYIATERIVQEQDEFVTRIHESLAVLQQLRNDPSPNLQKKHFRCVETLFKLKHSLPQTLHLQLIEELVWHLWTNDARAIVDIELEVRAVRMLRLLLKKWKSRVAPSEAAVLALDWRLAKRAIDRVCFSSPGQARVANPALLQMLAAAMVSCVEKARPWFGLGTSTSLVEELWNEFGPQINNVKSNRCFQALGYFTVLFNIPTDANEREWQVIQTLIPQWLQSWSLISRCADWDGHWFKLFARITKRFPVEVVASLHDAMRFVFAKVHDLLNLPSDLGSPFKNNARPAAYSILDGTKRYDQLAMRLCAYLLVNPTEDSPTSANQYLVEILTTVKPFFHPSNASAAACSLINTVYFLSSAIAQRLGSERATTELLKIESCRDVVEALLQLSFYGIYSKNRSVASRCMYVIKSLVCIDPAYCARPVLDEMVKALDPRALSQSHLAPAAISSLSVFLYHLMCGQHPDGAGLLFSTYLAPLLRLTLPGIDANDDTKTITTLRLYFHVLSWLPLVNDVEKKGGDDMLRRDDISKVLFDDMEASAFTAIVPHGSEIVRKMWELGSFLEEWTLALVDRCLDFLRTRANTQSHDSVSKGSADGGENAQREDQVVLEVLNMMGLLYNQMSPALYSQALRKTVNFVSSSFFTSAFGGKVIASLVSNCIQCSCHEAIPVFVRVALDKLQVSKASSLMTNEKVWYLHILNGAVRINDSSASTLLAFRDELRTTIAHYLAQEEKEVYEASGHVLEELLNALLGVYPMDFRSLPPEEWKAATSTSTSMFQFLGAAVSWKRLQLQWHEPNEEELAFAQDLLQDHLLTTFAILNKLRESGDVSVREWMPHLKRVYASVRGARNVFVDSTGGQSVLQAGSLPLLERACGANTKLRGELVSLKSTVMLEIHAIVHHWQSRGQKGVTENQVWKVLLKVMKQLVVWRGSHIGSHRSKEKQNMYIKMVTTDVASKQLRKSRRFEQNPQNVVPLSSRNEMVERVLFFYSKRKVQEHFETAQFVFNGDASESLLRQQYEALLLDIDDLTKHPYEEVRNNASAVMRESYEIFMKWIYSRISNHLTVLEGNIIDDQGHVKEEIVSGTLEFLKRPLVLSFFWKSRGVLLERVLKAVLGSNDAVVKKLETEASKAKVGLKIQAFFLALLAIWRYVHDVSSKSLISALLASEPPATEHWKQQLMHLVCFFPLLQQEEVPLPIEFWKLIVRRLEHDVLPVRQVAVILLSQLVKLEKWHRSTTGTVDAEVTALLFSNATLKVVISSMLENHRNSHRFSASADGQHANSAPSDWSFGVSEVIRNLSNTSNAYPKPPPLSSIRLLNHGSDVFKNIHLIHVKLVQRLTRMNPRSIIESCVFPALDEQTNGIDAKASDEDRQASLSLLGEGISGMTRAVLKLPSGDEELAVTTVSSVLNILKKVLPQVNLANVEPWTQVLYYTSRPSNASPSELQLTRLEPVVRYVLKEFEASFARASVDDYADQVKWLSLIEPLLLHLLGSTDERVGNIRSAVRSSVVLVIQTHALAHRYKMVRDRAAKTLYILDVNHDKGVSGSRVSSALLENLAARAQVKTGIDVDDSTENEDASSAKETAMQWLVCVDRYGEPQDFLRVMKSLFPIAFLSQNDAKVEIALLAKNTANAISLSLRLHFPPADTPSAKHLNELFEMLEQLASHSLWKTRAGILRFLTLFTFYHWIFFTSEQQARIQKLIMQFLADEQREIQDMAKYALRSLAHNQRPTAVGALSRQLTDQAQDNRVKHPKLIRRLQKQEQEQPGDTDEQEKTRARIKATEQKMATSILGMSAIVLAFPYSVPEFVPPLFEEMGRYLYIKHSTPTISYLEKSVKDTLLEFKRTHQDNWLEIKSNFTQQQRDVFEDVIISPSYYT